MSADAKSKPILPAWTVHLLSFAMPSLALTFVLTGPHRWFTALPFAFAVATMVILDERSGPARTPPPSNVSAAPFDALLVGLALLQFVTIGLFVRMASHATFLSLDTLVGVILLGSNSGYSAIVVAHELIHRKNKALVLLGRLLLVTVLYEHFSTEHVRGHHARVATADDPATARFGESFTSFWRRTVKGQFLSAWHLDKVAVLEGVIAQIALLAAVAYFFGPVALAYFALQALVAIRLLEAVNYFEHWGLRRTSKKVRTVDSWDSDSWFTLHTLIGLSRHADHHAYASRPYHALRPYEESPKLPTGYLGMVVRVFWSNDDVRRLMTAELERKRLGPFAES